MDGWAVIIKHMAIGNIELNITRKRTGKRYRKDTVAAA